MAEINVTKTEMKKFVEEYKQIPPVKCKKCGHDIKPDFDTFVIVKKLRERYY